MMNLLIIGGTGFLGRNLIKYILTHKKECNIIITGHSEYKIAFLKKNFPEIITYKINIDNLHEKDKIDGIIVLHKITHIIHAAAMKYVNICQENIVDTLNTNVIFTSNLISICQKNRIKNLIAISTDKANNPCNVYGMSKYMMELLIKRADYKLFRGVNFFWSDGSVLDIWYKQYKFGLPLTYTDLKSVRYYNSIDHISKTIINGFDSREGLILTDYVYRISLASLLKAFTRYFNYRKTIQIEFNDYEKRIEELIIPNKRQIEIIEPNIKDIIIMIAQTYQDISSIIN